MRQAGHLSPSSSPLRAAIALLVAGALLAGGCPQRRSGKRRERGSTPPAGRAAGGPLAPFATPPSGEGMWPWADLARLDEKALRARGLRVPLARIWTPGRGGLAAAVIGLDGCSASFVSARGLILTNHHCAYRIIQRNSSPRDDLLAKGLVARTRAQERPGYGARALVFLRERDVTREIIGTQPKGLGDAARYRRVESREKALVARCERRPRIRCSISRENDGQRFLLYERLEIPDVRLVAAPPAALGNFGGEIDNFRWPRHTLDFALLRAYVGPDGRPREPHPDNIPYRPQRYLAASPRGVTRGDLVMVLGTPGRTRRYATTEMLRQQQEWLYPHRVDLFSEWSALLRRTATEIPAARLPLASLLRRVDNVLTNARGMLAGLRRRRVLARRRTEEASLRRWIAARPERRRRWGGALERLLAHERGAIAGRERDFLLSYLTMGVSQVRFATSLARWAHERTRPDAERKPGFQDRDRARVRRRLRYAQRSYHPEADRRVFALFLKRMGRLDRGDRLAAVDRALGGDWRPAAIDAWLEKLYTRTRLGDARLRLRLLERPWSEIRRHPDPMLRLGVALLPELLAWERRKEARQGARFRLRPPYLAALAAFRGKRFYPDANRSPRITFAHVAGYAPRDGVWHRPFTTVVGLVEKHRGRAPFDVPATVRAAAQGRRWGRYADSALGSVPACFLSNADTTGGNSGSPVLDGQGRLVGLNFDRVYENISGDFGYEPTTSRNIMVDIRYLLWYLDVVAGAEHLATEMGGRDRG